MTIRSNLRRGRSRAVLLAMLAISLGALVAIAHLQQRATASRDAETKMVKLQLQLSEIQDIPWLANPDHGAPVTEVRRQFADARRRFQRDLAALAGDGMAREDIARVERPFRATMEPLARILDYVQTGDVRSANEAAGAAWRYSTVADEALIAVGKRYRADAAHKVRQTLFGSGGAIALLFGAFAVFLRRSTRARREAEQLAAENHELLEVSREQATTDALTGLGNRRALSADLATSLEQAGPDDQVVLALFDLDGFKAYNDSFGHPAGDALLARLGERLRTTMDAFGVSYRMGGDEFCVLAPVSSTEECDTLVRLAAAALSEQGDAFRIGSSYGYVLVPSEATTSEDALRLADQRMYSLKSSGRASASRQSADVLVRALAARSGDLQDHVDDVSRLAEATARSMGLPDEMVNTIRLAAELHDVGKVGIPDAILSKRDKLDDTEWNLIRRHTLIGERIILGAPSLQHAAGLVRSSHERIDGRGYPDGLRGDDIPIGARVIAVCDAYDAMISDRVYRKGMSRAEACAELWRCAGTQFDEEVVQAFTALSGEFERDTDSPSTVERAGGLLTRPWALEVRSGSRATRKGGGPPRRSGVSIRPGTTHIAPGT